ncbi:hypothetical protein QFZ31_006311 [Neobacillus niacini]|uniref:hypothetical protein n=1 Tax=Neobacillus driksii TaxID=3035913 RepID=UPI00278639C5|nr:hypothetical protein [Neobacillus niacini]MDQ0976433.1 hypothetical protein [Neobacillus niacini]
MSRLTAFIPAQGWGIFFFAQALFFIVLGFNKGLFSLNASNIQSNYRFDGTKEY